MLVAANLAITISLGASASHSMSHPCGAHFGVPHGVANAINLPLRDRASTPRAATESPTATATIDEIFDVERAARATVGHALAEHVTRASLGRSACPRGCPRSACPRRGSRSSSRAPMGDGSTLLNPRETTADDFAELYRKAM